ncbi:MAG: porin [Opitutales bacterium]|nr:porin [Opitutales bacterium]
MSPRPAKSRLLASMLASVLCLSAAPLHADDEERVHLLEDFDVISRASGYWASNATSATRTNLPVQDLPISLNVITEDFIRDIRATTSFEALKYSAGVTGGPTIYDGNLTMRGFQTDNVYVNGYRSFGTPTTISLDRVEVIRGPAAVIYGQTQPGGIANFVTKKPRFEDHLDVSLTTGSWEYLRATADMGGLIVPERFGENFAYRLNVGYETRGDYQDFVSRDIFEIAGAVSMILSPRAVLNVEATHVNSRRNIGSGPIVDGFRTGFVDVPSRNNYWGPNAFVNVEAENVQADLRVEITEWMTSRSIFTRQWRKQVNNLWGPNVMDDLREVPEEDLTEASFFNVPEGWAVPVGQDLSSDAEYFSQIFIFDFDTGGFSHQLQVGYDRDRRSATFNGNLQFNDPEAGFGGGLPSKYGDLRDYPGPEEMWWRTRNYPDGDGWVATFFLRPSANKNDQFYFVNTVQGMDDRLNVLFGLRYVDLRQSVTSGGTWGQATTEYEDSTTVPQLGASYAVQPGVNLFALYSESVEPNQTRPTVDGRPLPPLKGEGIDLGIKLSLLDEQLNATLSFFEVKRTNVAIGHPDDDGDPEGDLFGIWIPGGNARSRGFETEVFYTVNDAWQIYATYARTDASWRESDVFERGTRLGHYAKHKATLFAKYEVPEGPLEGLSVRGGIVYTSDRFGADFGEGPIRLPSDVLFDAGIGYTAFWNDVPVELDLFVENITNEDYLWGFGNNRNFNVNRRNVQLSARIRF